MTTVAGLIRGAAWSEAADIAASVVMVRSRAGAGAGTAWRDDGLVVTNSHVVHGDRVQIMTHDEQSHTVRLVVRDEQRDLALLQVTDAALTPVAVRDSSSVRVGEIVFAVGNPWGRVREVTFGVVTSVEAPASLPIRMPGAIYADVQLAPGNSGGPLADAQGRVIGVNHMIAHGMAVAIPSSAVLDLIAGRRTERGSLGIAAIPVPLPEVGVGLLVSEVRDGSAASRAGLLVGDIVVAIDGYAGDLRVLGEQLGLIAAGQDVRIDLLRGGLPRSIAITATAAA